MTASPFLFQFENRKRGGEMLATIAAALLCAASLYATGWLLVAGVRALKVGLGLAAGCVAAAAAIACFAAGLIRYIVNQVKGGFTFLEKISIDASVVHYVYRDIEGEKWWSEPLASYEGVRLIGYQAGRRGVLDSKTSRLVLKSLPKSTGLDSGAPAARFQWVVMLVHPVLKKCVRLRWEGSAEGTVSDALSRAVQDEADRLRVPVLPPLLPVEAEPAA